MGVSAFRCDGVMGQKARREPGVPTRTAVPLLLFRSDTPILDHADTGT